MNEQLTENKRHILSPQNFKAPTNVTRNLTGTKKLLPSMLIAILLAGAPFSLLTGCSKEKEEPVQQATTESNIPDTKPAIVAQAPPSQSSTELFVEIEIEPVVPDMPGRYPLASSRLLTDTDLIDISKDELNIMRNEIYARHSYRFKNKKVLHFFSKQEWYTPRLDNVNNLLSDLEKTNIDTIKRFEKN